MEKKNFFVPEIRIPVGNSNFREIRKENFYYVDKTGFIYGESSTDNKTQTFWKNTYDEYVGEFF